MKVKGYFQFTTIVVSFLLLCACNSTGKQHKTIKTGVQATLQETLDTALEANLEADAPGLIVSVWQNGENLYTGMKGIARETKPITEHTQFRLASISKTFTAIAVLKLYEQGLLDLHAPIVEYLPELDNSWQAISIHHLLAHRSGIPDFFNELDFFNLVENDITNRKIMQYFVDNPKLNFEAGSKESYSNSGYILLAEIVSRVSGHTFSQYLSREVFNPLGMHDSYIISKHEKLTDRTALNFAETHQVFNRDIFAFGSGAQVSSMVDLQRFLLAFINQQVLQPETYDLMLTSYSTIAESMFNGTGYGLFYYSDDGDSVYGHTGGFDGFRTIFVVGKDSNAFMIILGNGGDFMPQFSYLMDLAGEFLQ